jgi:hypothetical protein
MRNDLTQRINDVLDGAAPGPWAIDALLREAVTEIERLKGELTGVAEGWESDPSECPAGHGDQCCRHASLCREALKGGVL